uniref:Succinyl-CoA ligase [GDP-forming] subunit beta, mitochondrial n=1 Tax=Lygus hesperus TaxID=30085 RepID=A0A0A9YLK6_LYGHE
MIGYSLVTKQTTADGQKVMKVLIHEGINFTEEKYFAIVLDRAYGGPVIIVSQEGGVDIEEVSEKNPEALTIVPIDIMQGLQVEQADKAATALGFQGKQKQDAVEQITNLYKMFVD